MQIIKKFLANGAIANLLNNVYLKGRNAANSADIDILKVNASDRIEFASLPQSSATPTVNDDLVNKAYADALTGSGATTALDNLAAVAINTSLISDTDLTDDLGSASIRWATVYASGFKSLDQPISIHTDDNAAPQAIEIKPNVTAPMDNGINSGSVTIATQAVVGSASSGDVVLSTGNAPSGTAGSISLTVGSGLSAGYVNINGGQLNMNTAKIINLDDPTAAGDAANKSYVDSVASAQKTWEYEALTLSAGDITAQYKDLTQVAVTKSIQFFVNGVWQRPTTDYTINYTGGAGGKTRLTFAGDLATGGAAELIAGDVIHIQYQY